MDTDYETLRGADDAEQRNGVAPVRARQESGDADDGELVESYELPGADLSGEELSATVVPRQHGEFVCMRCFLVQHRSHLARVEDDGAMLCDECA